MEVKLRSVPVGSVFVNNACDCRFIRGDYVSKSEIHVEWVHDCEGHPKHMLLGGIKHCFWNDIWNEHCHVNYDPLANELEETFGQ